MRKIIFILYFISAVIATQAQTNLDSLYSVWQDKTQSDSIRTEAYQTYIKNGFLYSNPDTAFALSQALLNFGEQHRYQRANAAAYSLMAVSNHVKSFYPKALDYYLLSLKIQEKIGDKQGMVLIINSIGIIFKDQGDYAKALDYHQRSLNISREIGYKLGMANAINNIGIIYKNQGDFTKALDYYQRSLKIFEKIGDKRGTASIIANIGIIYKNQGDNTKALDYFQSSLKIFEEIGDKRAMANTIMAMGSLSKNAGDYIKALDYYQRSLKIQEDIGDKKGMTNTINNIGITYKAQGDFVKALDYCKKALSISQEIKAIDKEKEACQCLYDTYKAQGKGNEALVYLEKILVIDDSLNEEETDKKLQKMEFTKQMFTDSIAQVEEKRLVEVAHKEEVRQKNQTRNILIGTSIFVILLAGGVYSRLRFTNNAKAIIEKEKKRSDELLLNILPEEVAEELKESGIAVAKNFSDVSVLFTDFKGFTRVSEKMKPEDLVQELHHCFSAFDKITQKFGLEKIKTIGDSYMAVAGLPKVGEENAVDAVRAGIAMSDFMKKYNEEKKTQGKEIFEMRVGIHSGPVVAGIVGVKKFAYDIWGDTVNTASRMESNGEVGKVNISGTTYELVKNYFTCTHRGKITVKNKGDIDMYFVEGGLNSITPI